MPNGDNHALRAHLTELANDAAKTTDEALQQELLALRGRSRADLDRLRPTLACDEATFTALVQVVEDATAKNIAIAEFTARLKKLGDNVLLIARHASSLMPLH